MADSAATLSENLESLTITNSDVNNNNSTADDITKMFDNLKEDELIRGSKPIGLEARCLKLCQTYIGGSWCQTTDPADITVTRITGGLTNQLYRVQLASTVERVPNAVYPDEPSEVAIKLYMPKHMQTFHVDDGERLNDIVVLTILSEVNIGPKVYGIFGDGVLQEFVDHEQFTKKYQQNEPMLRTMVATLARVHHLNVPIRKNNDWLSEQIKVCFEKAYNERNAEALINEVTEHLKRVDPRRECEQILKILSELQYPKVFCHNDFRGSNILVRKSDQAILFVDLEYSAYGCRGYDLATYINEWGFEPFEIERQGLPSDEVLRMFVGLYIAECDKLMPGYATKKENSVDVVIKELKIMSLALYLFFTSFMMKADSSLVDAIPFDPKNNMKFCDFMYMRYLEIKKRLVADGTIKV